MSQFERDLHFAIQQSLEEEKKKQEEQNQNKPGETNVTPSAENKTETNNDQNPLDEAKMDIEEDEDAELEKARLLSIQEHDGLLKKKEEEDSKYFKHFFSLNF